MMGINRYQVQCNGVINKDVNMIKYVPDIYKTLQLCLGACENGNDVYVNLPEQFKNNSLILDMCKNKYMKSTLILH